MNKNYSDLAVEAQAKEVVERGAKTIMNHAPTDWPAACSLAGVIAAESLRCLLEEAAQADEQTLSVGRIKRLRDRVLHSAVSNGG